MLEQNYADAARAFCRESTYLREENDVLSEGYQLHQLGDTTLVSIIRDHFDVKHSCDLVCFGYHCAHKSSCVPIVLLGRAACSQPNHPRLLSVSERPGPRGYLGSANVAAEDGNSVRFGGKIDGSKGTAFNGRSSSTV